MLLACGTPFHHFDSFYVTYLFRVLWVQWVVLGLDDECVYAVGQGFVDVDITSLLR